MLRAAGRRLFGRVLPKGMVLPILKGPLRGTKLILGSPAGPGGGGSLYFGLYEPDETTALQHIVAPGQVFFDIGANIGYYSLLTAKLVGVQGCVVAFEPLVRNVALLSRHTQLNHANNVTIVPCACAESSGIQEFSLGDNSALGHLVVDGVNTAHTIIVPTIRVDEYVDRSGLEPNVMKIDVEGSELSVLKGSSLTLERCRPWVLLSTHSNELTHRCKEYLVEKAYRVRALSGKTASFVAEPDC